MKIDELPEQLAYVIKNMCFYAGVDPDEIDFKEDRWYEKYTWSEKEQKAFEDWLTDELSKNRKLRKELLGISSRLSKKFFRRTAQFFTLAYGWKLK